MSGSLGAEPFVTVVVPTYRRDAALARALGGLARQNDPDVAWDVVVVDNDDAPGADATFRAAAADFPVPIRLVREHCRGASRARNRGMAEATGTIIAFMDDDVVPELDWLRCLLDPVLAGRSDAAGGRVVLDPSVRRPDWFDGSWMSQCLAEFAPGREEHPLPARGYVLTASAAFRADLLRATGGLDEVLGPRPGLPMVNDDMELCHRFAALGGTIRYVPEAVVVHELPGTRLRRRYLVRRHYAQGRSDWLIEREALVETRTGGIGAAWANLVEVLGWHWREGSGREEGATGRRFDWLRAACELARVGGILREAVAFKVGRQVAPVRPKPVP